MGGGCSGERQIWVVKNKNKTVMSAGFTFKVTVTCGSCPRGKAVPVWEVLKGLRLPGESEAPPESSRRPLHPCLWAHHQGHFPLQAVRARVQKPLQHCETCQAKAPQCRWGLPALLALLLFSDACCLGPWKTPLMTFLSQSVWWKAHDENPWQFAWARCWPRFRHRAVRCRKEIEHVHAGEPPSSPSLPSPSLPLPPSLHLPRFWRRAVSCGKKWNVDTQEPPSKPSSLLTPSACPNPHSPSPSPLSLVSWTPDERPPWRETTSLLRPLSEPICFTFPCKWTSVPRTAPPPPPLLKTTTV